jgi:hypothetical protein
MEQGDRPRHGARRRCDDPKGKGCRQFARRGHPSCAGCGGGTRAEKRHELDQLTGETRTTNRGLVSVPPRIQQLLDGTLPIEDLDEEELARGYPRATDGTFRNPPVVIPRAIHNRMMQELFRRANTTLKESLSDAAATMTNIINDPKQDPKIRLEASKWLIERIMGKTPEVVVNVEDKRYEKLFDRMARGGQVGMTIDGEVVTDGRTP